MLGKLTPGDVMLAVLGGLADVERDLIRTPTALRHEPRQGSRKAHGPAQQKEAIRPRAQGATLDELARSYNVQLGDNSRLAIPS